MSGQGESALLENLQKSQEKDKFCSTAVQVKTANTTRWPFCQRNQSTTSWSSKAEASTQKEWEACGKNLSREKEPLILDQSIPEASYTIIHSKIIIIITATTIFILANVAISPSSKGVAIHQLFPEGLMISQMARCRSSFCNLSCITQIGGRPIEESHHHHPHHHPHHRHHIKRDEEAAGFLQNENCTKHRLVMVERSAGPMWCSVWCKERSAAPISTQLFTTDGHQPKICVNRFPFLVFLNAQYRYQTQSRYKCLMNHSL